MRRGDRVRMLEGKPVLRTDVGCGETGIVTVCDPDLVAIRLDRHFEILDEWENELVWTNDDVEERELGRVADHVARLVEILSRPA